jgi:hypothetical protein
VFETVALQMYFEEYVGLSHTSWSFSMSRETNIEKLKTDIACGRVVVIAGTGISIMACGNQKIDGYRVAT